MAPPPEAQPLIGVTLVGRYRIDQFIGQGYFSFVYAAYDCQSGNQVAVKILKPSRATAESILEIQTERELLRRLADRDHVPDCYEGESDTLQATVPGAASPWSIPIHFVAMELADGSLDEIVSARHKTTWIDRLALFRSAAKSLHQMHLSGIAHRDFKSSNILLFTARSTPPAKVGDLGRSASRSDPRRFPIERYEFGRGDMTYAPPEFLWGTGGSEVGWYLADLYLLGSLLCELATGQPLTSFTYKTIVQEAAPFLREPVERRRVEFRSRVTTLDSVYERAWSIFAGELRPSIRQVGVRLIRQLTDPDPSRRGPSPLADRVRHWDLNWVLRRTDIMIRILEHEEQERRRLAEKRRRRSR